MKILEYIILGILQGFTEPLPISSSGHLLLFKEIFNIGSLNDINFEIISNFGSLLAIIILFRKDIINLVKNFFKYTKDKNKKYKDDYNYLIYIIISTIPIGIIGFLFKDVIERFNNTQTIGISLLITASLLYLLSRIKGTRTEKDMNIKDSIYIGLLQIFALIPGISRSGITLSAGMFRNFKKEDAFKYSFMLYIPVSLATMILGVKDFVVSSSFAQLWLPYLLGLIASFIVTYFTFNWFRKVLLKNKIIYFSIYCLIIGILTLIFL